MTGTSRPVLATTKTNNTKFIDWPACQLRQYFPSIWLGWPNTTYSKFIRRSFVPADLMEDFIIGYIEFKNMQIPKTYPVLELEQQANCAFISTCWKGFILSLTASVVSSQGSQKSDEGSGFSTHADSSLCLWEIPFKCADRASVVCERWMDMALTSLQKQHPRGVTAQGPG